MSDNKWHKGPPPSDGWWPTRTMDGLGGVIKRQSLELRWRCNGKWSVPVLNRNEGKHAPIYAAIPTSQKSDAVEWQHRPASWPKRSRT